MQQEYKAIVLAIIVGVTILVVLLVFFFLLFAQFIKRKQKHQKEVEEIKYQYQQTIYNSQIEIQELTFKKIGQELHDNVGQLLTVSSINLTSLKTNDIHMQNTAHEYLKKALAEIRNISHSLSLARINETDIYTFIENEAKAINVSQKAVVNFDCKALEAELDKDAKLIVFRIIQEILSNCIRHAHASIIDIFLEVTFLNFKLIIKDNGKGFDMNQVVFGDGLANIKKRTELLKGKFLIQSSPKLGTEISINIPIA
ncbi:MAG: sensor histidine kinase [Chitinophagaceae bacterium]